MIESLELLKKGEYYRLNGTKKILYWNGEVFMQPVKDNQKKYSGWIRHIEKQPKFKFAELIKEQDINALLL
jgi:hypothetical protein